MTDELQLELKRVVNELRERNPALTRDKAFVMWFVQAFLTDDPSEVDSSVVGGRNDKNIDGIYIDSVCNTVFVIQGKYRANEKKRESRPDLVSFAAVAEFFLGSKAVFNSMADNADVGMRPLLNKARFSLINKKYQLALQYVTSGSVSSQYIEELEAFVGKHDAVTIQVFDHKALRRLMRDYIDGVAPPVPAVKIRIESNETFDSYDPLLGVSSWVFTTNGKELAGLFNRWGVRIFARNIRGFMGGATTVNKGMV